MNSMEKKPLYIVGCGGQAKEVFCYIKKQGYNVTGFIEQNIKNENYFMGLPVFNEADILKSNTTIDIIIAVGSPSIKRKISNKFKKRGNVFFPSIIDKSAIIYDDVDIGKGCIIGPGVILTTNIKLGEFVLLNFSTTVGHDVKIGNFTTINPGCNVSGNVIIGEQCDIGTGTQIIQGRVIANKTVIGAGSVLINDIDKENCLLVGAPAKVVRENYGT